MIRVRQIKISVLDDNALNLKIKISKILRIKIEKIKDIKIVKKSIDARIKSNIFYVYEVDVDVLNESEILKKNKSKDIFLAPKEEYSFKITGTKKILKRIIIVGSGPAGLFAAYELSKHGYRPLIIERGEKIEKRIETVEEFWKNGKLDVNSNIQFGEGGAGTFSDGKLNTLVKDKAFRGKEVFEVFVKCGADDEIMYLSKPHIGTDLLRKVIINLRKDIIKMGGEFRYNTTLTDILVSNNKITGIFVNGSKKIECDCLILATGHSARDTIEMLYQRGVEMKPKSFAVGLRIEHPQDMINESQYGDFSKIMKEASYKLTYTTKSGRGVYSFCMCPGGYVINASSEENMLVVNGMSNHKRDTGVANSAIVVTVNPSDFGNSLFDGIKFQRELESKAYKVGHGNIPVQRYEDFVINKPSCHFGTIKPLVKGKVTLANLNECLPYFVSDAIKEAMCDFEKKINGFSSSDALLFGIESRTSSPIRIERSEGYEANILGLFPCGEGSGYAGGITTAAMDGIKVAEAIAKIYKSDICN